MPDREKVIKGLEQFKDDFKPFCGNDADWARVDDAIAMLKEQDNMISIKAVSDYLAEYALPPTLQNQNLFSFNGNMASEWEQFLRDLKGW